MYFYYAEREVEYLKAKDERLREVIEKIGHVDREVDTDLFSSVVHHIIGAANIDKGAGNNMGENESAVWRSERREHFGSRYRYVAVFWNDIPKKLNISKILLKKVKTREFALQEISQLPDNEAIQALASLKGIGVWTAEMILLFCLQRA